MLTNVLDPFRRQIVNNRHTTTLTMGWAIRLPTIDKVSRRCTVKAVYCILANIPHQGDGISPHVLRLMTIVKLVATVTMGRSVLN
jgi:hypothetical protein